MKNSTKEQLNRMIYMMNYGKVNETQKPYSTVEYTHEGADGKMYGLVREGTKYYIKTSEKKSNNQYLKEDFDYIGGFPNKFRHEYSSFNNGLKQMDMFLRELNEECGRVAGTIETWSRESNSYISTPISESMKQEISRQKQIMENASRISSKGNINESLKDIEKNNIGKVPNEAPKTGSTKEGDVFSDDVKEPTDTIGVNNNKDYVKKSKTNGNEVGDSTPFTEKSKKMNCNEEEDKNEPYSEDVCPKCGNKECTCEEKELSEDFKIDNEDSTDDGELVDDTTDMDEPSDDETPFTDDEIDSYSTDNEEIPTEDENGMSKIESLLQQIVDRLDAIEAKSGESSEEELYGDDETKDEPISDNDETEYELDVDNDNTDIEGNDDEDEPFKESINPKAVLEDRLNDFGKHPKYQKQPIDGLNNDETLKDGQYDMADDSIKSTKPYGTEIGDSMPYTISPKILRDSIAEAVTKVLKKKLAKDE